MFGLSVDSSVFLIGAVESVPFKAEIVSPKGFISKRKVNLLAFRRAPSHPAASPSQNRSSS
jgi:hypothetical protein